MNDNPFKGLRNSGIEIPKIDFEIPSIQRSLQTTTQQMNKIHQEMVSAAQEKYEIEEKYKQDTLNTLRNIEKNTGDISQLVFLLNTNTEKQTEILAIMTEILSIGISKSDKEAESKYRTVMTKITQTFEDADTMEKLLGYSKMFYHSAKEYIKLRIENG